MSGFIIILKYCGEEGTLSLLIKVIHRFNNFPDFIDGIIIHLINIDKI